MNEKLFWVIFVLVFIGLPILLILLAYKLPKRMGHLKTAKYLSVAAFIILVPLSFLGGYSVVLGAFNTNFLAPGIKLTKAEKKMVRHIEEEYHCKMGYRHDYQYITYADTTASSYYDPKVFSAEMTWFYGYDNEGYDVNNDMCRKDSATRLKFVTAVFHRIADTMNYREHYKSVRIYLTTIHRWNKRGSGSECMATYEFALE